MIETMLWQRLDVPGHEIATLEPLDAGWKLAGTAIWGYRNSPAKLDYVVICDAQWRTTWAHVSGTAGPRQIDLVISVDTRRRWCLNGTEIPAVEGCSDI